MDDPQSVFERMSVVFRHLVGKGTTFLLDFQIIRQKNRAVKCLQLPSHHLAAPFVGFKFVGLTLLIDKYVAAKIQRISASCNRGKMVDMPEIWNGLSVRRLFLSQYDY